MRVALIVATVVLSLLLVLTAKRKLSHRDDVVESYARVGVPEKALNFLAITLLLAAGGLVSGLRWPLLGLITSVGLVGYFVVAILSHIRAGDHHNLTTPLVYETLTIALMVLHLADGE